MILGHTIALDPTEAQAAHFRRAAGVARFAYNWALAEWRRMYAAGEKPTAHKIKVNWNAARKAEFPWSYEVTKCASGQSILDLGSAFSNFFRDLKKPKGAHKARFPRFKKKRAGEGFALWNDQFAVNGTAIRIPNLGWVRMREPLRFAGKIIGARVSCRAGRWAVSVQVETEITKGSAPVNSVVGIDLGITTLLVLSQPLLDGRTLIANPKARRGLIGRQRKMSRRISRQETSRRKSCAKTSNRQRRRQLQMAKLHGRMAAIRKDALHKATSLVAANFSTIVIENLNVFGMSKNHALAGAILDAAFGEIRRQLEYKAAMRGGRVVVADRFFPSSKMCSACGDVVDSLPLQVRSWVCPSCGSTHDRDRNAAKNLEDLVVGPAWAEPSSDYPADTRGDIAALAAGKPATKLRWLNRDLNPCSHSSTN